MPRKPMAVLAQKANLTFIGKNLSLYRLENFNIALLVKIHLHLQPKSKLLDRKNSYSNFLKIFGDSVPHEINDQKMRDWLHCYMQDNQYSERTMSHIKCQLNYFFKWMQQKDIIQTNPLDQIKFRQNMAPKRPRVILSANEIQDMLSNLKGHSANELYPFIYTLVQTGARRSEILNLSWADIDFQTHFIHLKKTKNGDNRKIKMSKGLYELLKNKHSTRVHDFFVFTGKNEKKLGRQKINRLISSFTNMYPIPNKEWRCHDLRHSFAYNFLKKGGEMYQLKAILGHKTIQMTVDLYGALKAADIGDPSPYPF